MDPLLDTVELHFDVDSFSAWDRIGITQYADDACGKQDMVAMAQIFGGRFSGDGFASIEVPGFEGPASVCICEGSKFDGICDLQSEFWENTTNNWIGGGAQINVIRGTLNFCTLVLDLDWNRLNSSIPNTLTTF